MPCKETSSTRSCIGPLSQLQSQLSQNWAPCDKELFCADLQDFELCKPGPRTVLHSESSVFDSYATAAALEVLLHCEGQLGNSSNVLDTTRKSRCLRWNRRWIWNESFPFHHHLPQLHSNPSLGTTATYAARRMGSQRTAESGTRFQNPNLLRTSRKSTQPYFYLKPLSPVTAATENSGLALQAPGSCHRPE